MSADRWSDETQDLVAEAIVDHAWLTETDSQSIAGLALAALADAGLLLPSHAERSHPDDWPAMAEGIATRAIRESLPDIALSAPNLIARRIMADLVGADLLAVPGETRQEWGVSYPNLHPEPVRCADEDMARHTAGAAFGRAVTVRTVHTGPWRDASDPTAAAPTSAALVGWVR